MLFRSVFGTILNMCIVKYFNNIGISGIKPNNLYSSAISSNGVSSLQVKLSLNSGLHEVFIAFIIIAIVSFALTFTFDSKSNNNLCKK